MKCTPFGYFRLYTHFSSQIFDDLFSDGQAHAGAGKFAVGMKLLKDHKYFTEIFRFNAYTIILHPKLSMITAASFMASPSSQHCIHSAI